MVGGRILVVDDTADWRLMVGGLLGDAGYEVQVAADEDEAMHILRQQPYHVAIVDLRLDERNEQDVAGLDLARRMKEYFPELVIIILTAYADVKSVIAALEPMPDGDRIAFDFVEKFKTSQLLSRVRRAFETSAHVNPQLQIELHQDLEWQHLQDEIECLRPLNPEDAEQELRDLLQRLFHKSQRIHVKPLLYGHSSGSVVLVTPATENIPQTDVVVKFNERNRAGREASNYDQYVARHIRSARRTQRLDFRSTARLGGIAYSFIGGSATKFRRFGQLYETANVPQLKHVLDNLFLETCQTWYANSLQFDLGKQALGSCYRQWLGLTNTKLKQSLLRLTRDAENAPLVLSDPARLDQSAVRLALSDVEVGRPLILNNAAFPYDGPFCFTHGDLHEDNILVDNHDQTWLIDFYHTGLAHPARDFALLESAIKFYMQRSQCPLAVLVEWERYLVQVSTLSENPSIYWSLSLDPQLAKATELIVHVRDLLQRLVPDMTLRDYQVALYFHALKGMTLVRKLSETQRAHALVSAALMAENMH